MSLPKLAWLWVSALIAISGAEQSVMDQATARLRGLVILRGFLQKGSTPTLRSYLQHSHVLLNG